MATNTNLTESQRQTLQIFQEITQVDDLELSLDVLNQNRWDIDLAVESFVANRSRSLSSSSNQGPTAFGNNENFSNRVSHNSSSQNTDAPGSSYLIDVVMNPIKWLFQTHPLSLNPVRDANKFKEDFDSKYNSSHPRFLEHSYNTAVSHAFRGPKLLLVYLHSPKHEDTNRFCRQVLCSQTVSRFVDDNMIFWGGNIWDPEAYGLGMQLRASAFPFLALLMCQSERTVQIVDRIQGYMEERPLLERLQGTVSLLSTEVIRIQQETSMREESARLREEQDREYREAMEADRRERERRAAEAEARERAEEEARQRAEEEAAVHLSQKLDRQSKVERARRRLSEEPGANDSSAAMIRFQLPQGTKISRRFLKTDSIEAIYNYLTVYFYDNNLAVSNFAVSTNYPKRQLDDMATTVEDTGLFPRGVLFVQDLDA